MHAEVPTIPPVINVDAELDHWRRQHADGALPHNSFGSYVPWIKFACDSLITQPRASNAQRDEMFQTQYALQIMPRLSESQAREFVDRCWQHVYSDDEDDRQWPVQGPCSRGSAQAGPCTGHCRSSSSSE